MANKNWIGSATQQRDVWTITVANTWAALDVGNIIINGRTLATVIGSLVTTGQVAVSLKEAVQSTTFTDSTASVLPVTGGTGVPEMSDITASVSGSTVILTADGNGPHTITVSETTAGTGTLSIAHTVTSTGPNYWDAASNWAEGAVPVDTNAVIIDRPVSILYGLDASAVTLASLTLGSQFTAASYLGQPERNVLGYEDYRVTQLLVGATVFTDYGTSGRVRWNAGAIHTDAVMFGSTIEFVGTESLNTWKVYGGDLSIAADLGELANVATLTIAEGVVTCGIGATLTTVVKNAGTLTLASSTTSVIDLAGTSTILGGTHTLYACGGGSKTFRGSTILTTLRQMAGTVTLEPSVAWTTIDKTAGTLVIASGGTTLTSDGGITRVLAGAITTLNCNGGALYLSGTGTIGTLNLKNCTVYFDSGTTAGITVTTMTVVGDVVFVDTAARVTVTNAPTGYNGRLTYKPAT